jgi:hypothetical protein
MVSVFGKIYYVCYRFRTTTTSATVAFDAQSSVLIVPDSAYFGQSDIKASGGLNLVSSILLLIPMILAYKTSHQVVLKYSHSCLFLHFSTSTVVTSAVKAMIEF